ncbi:MAG: hypothetical protein K9H49_15750 [Bacteroidales bacterium]|nr:hypothetical protein [Bacteroidales bacterium]MCF8391062.1 hypothetical protein [Bacteroidales bacterium]
MKRVISLLYFSVVLVGVLNFSIPGQKIYDIKKVGIEQSESNNLFYSSELPQIFNIAAKSEINLSSFIRLLPLNQNVIPFNLTTKKRAELAINNEISDYLYKAEGQIIQFKGTDIIHPFDYFW